MINPAGRVRAARAQKLGGGVPTSGKARKEHKMHPPDSMSAVIGGKRYKVETATLLAGDDYWDGHNFERSGTNTFLYRTPKGSYFAVHLTQWEGASDNIEPLSEAVAKILYEDLRVKSVEYEDAFPGSVAEEA